jgi:WD repeat-containing protein 19
MVRIMLDKLNMTNEAVRVARDSRSNEGAKLVSKYFMGIGDYESAIQFLVISQCYQEAFQMADAEDKMGAFADAIERDEISEQYTEVAEYYAQRKNHVMAGKFFMLSGNYKQALDHLLHSKDDEEGIRLAIRSAAMAQDRDYTKRVIDFLMGELDGSPKVRI